MGCFNLLNRSLLQLLLSVTSLRRIPITDKAFLGSCYRCTHKRGYFGRGTKSLYCSSPALGRYVYIRKLMRGSLILCEVKVYAILRGRLFCNISSLLFHMLLMPE